jgi:hypothetical protein
MLRKSMLVLLCVACQPAESPEDVEKQRDFEAAMRLVCDVDRRSNAASVDDPLEKERIREDYLSDHVVEPTVVYHRTLWRVESLAERAKRVRELAKEAHLARCDYADAIQAEATE